MLLSAVLATVMLAVWLSHYWYYNWPTASIDRRWAKYVGDGAGFAVLCSLVCAHAWRLASGMGVLVVAVSAFGAVQGLQQAGCGLLRWGKSPSGIDLCTEQFGDVPYIAVAAVVFTWLLYRIVSARKK